MSSSPTPQLQVPVLSHRYAIRRKLGSGGTGTVYLAFDEIAKQLVALKVIRTERLLADSAAGMQAEFRAIALLRHPRIAAAYDFGYTAESGIPYYTREYVDGLPLPAGPPRQEAPRDFLRPILDVLEALVYLHENGILHLDIHADNVIVAADESRGSVLIDIGCRQSAEVSDLRISDASWPALPPELLRRETASERTDLFLVGRLLHYRLTGRRVGEPELPSEIPGWGARLTLALERILAKALQTEPAQRFASARQFRTALLQALGETAAIGEDGEPVETLLGREGELEAIEEIERRATNGESGVLWFHGRGGVGKSRLLTEARLRAQLRGLMTVEARFLDDPGPSPTLLHALRTQHAGARGGAAWLEPLAPHFGGSPAERARRAAESFFTGDGPSLILLIDDIDQADSESRLLIEALLNEFTGRAGKRRRGLGLIITSIEPPRRSRRLGARAIKPLGRAESRRLFADLLSPLVLPESLLERALLSARGVPGHLRRLAAALRLEWGRGRTVPETAEIPLVALSGGKPQHGEWASLGPREREVLDVMAVTGRSMQAREIAHALQTPTREVTSSLNRLNKIEAVSAVGRGRSRRHQLILQEGISELAAAVPRARVARFHRRLADLIQERIGGSRDPDVREVENVACHLLAAGRQRGGVAWALEAARRLRETGSFGRAVSVLERASRREKNPATRLQLAEAMSAILEEIGDHDKGIEVLAPFASAEAAHLSESDAVRVHRRLGIHYHRAGMPAEAMKVFASAHDLATPDRDLEDLIFIDSELAEIHIFQSNYEEARQACERGLRRIEERHLRDDFRGRVEVMLRASLGHIDLRKMRLDAARRELKVALELSASFGTKGDRAAILHNLGVTENLRCAFESARSYFRKAESLLLEAGERQNVVKICTNLCLIEAKLGARDAAFAHLERAEQMLRYFPSPRLECFASYSRGFVSLYFGDFEAAITTFERAIKIGRKIGDSFLQSFGTLYLAEAQLLSGRYGAAAKLLRLLDRDRETVAPLGLDRVIACRLFLVETLLGRTRKARAYRARYEESRRSDVVFLEAWNEVFLALGDVLGGTTAAPEGAGLEAALATFRELGIPAGVRFARLVLFLKAIAENDARTLATHLSERREPETSPHAFLAVAEPLACAAAALALEETEEAERWLLNSSSSIVGYSFHELDWIIELLRTHLTLKQGRVEEARRHLHRCLHSRDLLAHLVPAGSRAAFLDHPRFESVRTAAARLRVSPTLERPRRKRRPRIYEGMICESPAMQSLTRMIERLAGQEVSVLVSGETGTGKELVARAIWRRSARHHRPLKFLHCACLPTELFESELFGHAAGAFTGAEREQPGLLEDLDGGTLVLDEIGQLAPEAQAKMLTVIESGVVRRLGSVETRRVDVRYLAITNQELGTLVEKGAFRADLYYRLASLSLEVPPLRRRGEDIPLLAGTFLSEYAGRTGMPKAVLGREAVACLVRHDWPGNVRELETLIIRAMISLSLPRRITARDLEPLLDRRPRKLFDRRLLDRELADWRKDLEREYLIQLFFEFDGDLGAVMRRLGIKTTKLYGWFNALGIDLRELRRQLQDRPS